MRDSFVIETSAGRVRIWPYGESVVGIEFLDRPPPPPFPGLRPKVDAEQRRDVPKKTEP